jgi:hypothetical protein
LARFRSTFDSVFGIRILKQKPTIFIIPPQRKRKKYTNKNKPKKRKRRIPKRNPLVL